MLYLNKNNIQIIKEKLSSRGREITKLPRQKRLYFMMVFVFILIFDFYIFSTLMPTDIRQEGNVIDILAHYIGFSFGIIAPLFIEGKKLTL
jgi:hypothetical protein